MRNMAFSRFREDAVGDGMPNQSLSISLIEACSFGDLRVRNISFDGYSGGDLELVDSLETEVVVVLQN